MLIERKFQRVSQKGNNIYEYHIQCDSCGKKEWLNGAKCRHGERKFCSHKCINIGRKHSEEWKKELSLKNSGINNPFYGKTHPKEILAKIAATKEINGTSNIYELMRRRMGTEEFVEWSKAKSNKMIGENNSFYGKKHSNETKELMSQIKVDQIANGQIEIGKSKNLLKGWFLSCKNNEKFYYDSFYEFLRMKVLDMDPNVLTWTKRHGIKIPYTFNKINKNYVPDFFIKKIDGIYIEEIKGWEAKDKKNEKYKVLKNYCNFNDYKFSILERVEISDMCRKQFGKSLEILRKEFKEGVFL